MYHGIKFGDKRTWEDWHLVPTTRPVFNPPPLKSKYVDIPGSNGTLDLTESLTRYPLYGNRTGSFEFIVVNSFSELVTDHEEWYNRYSDIMDYIHGKSMKAILDDDYNYFYEGRFTVNSWKSEKLYSKIVIDYNVGPYKWEVLGSTDDWLWDPFNFNLDSTLQSVYKDIQLTVQEKKLSFTPDNFGRAAVTPKFTVSGQNIKGVNLRFVNNTLGTTFTKELPIGEGIFIPEFVFYGDKNVDIYAKVVKSSTGVSDAVAKGSLSINFRRGRL